MPDGDNNFGRSLVLVIRKWWRHLQPKNSKKKRDVSGRTPSSVANDAATSFPGSGNRDEVDDAVDKTKR